MRKILYILLLLCIPLFGGAQEQYVDTVFHDNIDRTANDFVIASLLISEPAKGLFSCMGHTALRMQCPTFGLDVVYHYCMLMPNTSLTETEAYLLGQFSVGMLADSFATYISNGEVIHRGITAYPLYLPATTKQKLWQLLDEEVIRGGYMHYDFFQEGCAIKTVHIMNKAVAPLLIDYSACLPITEYPKYEIIYNAMSHFPWQRFATLTAIHGTCQQTEYGNYLYMPKDLAAAWQDATLDGSPLSAAGRKITTHYYYKADTWMTPMRLAFILLVISIIGFFIKNNKIDYVVLIWLLPLSLFLINCLILRLGKVEWNWLIIPFNPFPILCWHWRRYWALPYAIVMLIWSAIMLFLPHMLGDPTHIILALALAITLLKQSPYIQNHWFVKSSTPIQ